MIANHDEIFGRLYLEEGWDENLRGSTMEATRPLRAFLEQFVVEHQVRSVLDVGCGMTSYAHAVDWKGARYLGVDVVPAVVAASRARYPGAEFVEGDARRLDAWAGFDLLLIKDVLQHWSLENVRAFLAQPALPSFKHVLVVNCDDERGNTDIADGDWQPLNLLALEAWEGARAVFRYTTKRVIHRGPRLAARDLIDRFEWWIINLDQRPDRLRHIREQLARIGVKQSTALPGLRRAAPSARELPPGLACAGGRRQLPFACRPAQAGPGAPGALRNHRGRPHARRRLPGSFRCVRRRGAGGLGRAAPGRPRELQDAAAPRRPSHTSRRDPGHVYVLPSPAGNRPHARRSGLDGPVDRRLLHPHDAVTGLLFADAPDRLVRDEAVSV
jgi:SAM-dependent methyltransferase